MNAEPAGADERLARLCRLVLAGNWREGEHRGARYAYTAPSPTRYPWQWYWDSCFAAIAWRRFDPARARTELQSLLAAATPDGFIGHTIFWGQPVDRVRRYFYNVLADDAFMTSTIQPPLLAWAWSLAVGDPAEVPGLARHHARIQADRDLDGDGLIWLVQPDESGLDASPAFDAVWGARSCGRPGFPLLVRHNRKLGFDLRRIAAVGDPVLCEPLTNTANNLSRLALGLPSLTPVILERLLDTRTGLFGQMVRRGRSPHAGPAGGVLTWAALSPLALPDLPEEVGRRLVEEYLLDERRFRLPVWPPSVSLDDASFSVRDRALGLRRYWRGPTWINAAWLLWLGLRRLGYDDAATDMARRLGAAVLASGLREYYQPFTGEGMGAVDFTWSTLVLEMVAPRGPAAGP